MNIIHGTLTEPANFLNSTLVLSPQRKMTNLIQSFDHPVDICLGKMTKMSKLYFSLAAISNIFLKEFKKVFLVFEP